MVRAQDAFAGGQDLLVQADLTLLAETAPDKKVRDAACRTLREAIELNVAEEAKLSRDRDREVRRANRDRKRAVRRHVALRLARRRA